MNILINSGRTSPFLGTRVKLVKQIISNNHNVILTGFQDGYETEIQDLGASFIKVPVERSGLNPLNDIRLAIKYYNIIKKNKIDVVHSYTIKPNIYGSIAARVAGVKEVYPTLNGIGYAFTGKGIKAQIVRRIASLLYYIAFRCSKRVFFHNLDDIEVMVNNGLIEKEKCVRINGSGIDLDHFKKEKLPEDISFLLISRLLKSKGIMEYLEAAKKVKIKYPNVTFKLIGPQDENPSGIKISDISYYVENKIIEYLGEQKDVRLALKDASVFVLPSYREGVSHTILEAMATGRAIITTDVPGCRDTTIEGNNGYLVQPYDSNDLAKKMIMLIENPKLIKAMGEESFFIAKEKFEVNKVNKVIVETMNI